MPKKQTKSITPKFTGYFDIIGWLNDQAHAGTEQSIKNLENFIAKEQQPGLKAHAEIAMDEAKYFYYCANNEQEEKDFLLAKMIRRKEEQIFDLELKADSVKLELEKLALDKKIHEQVIKSQNAKQAKEWKYYFSEDHAIIVRNELTAVEDDIAYLSAWVEQAKKIIKTKRFKTIPDEVIDYIHLDNDDADFCDEGMPCDCDFDK